MKLNTRRLRGLVGIQKLSTLLGKTTSRLGVAVLLGVGAGVCHAKEWVYHVANHGTVPLHYSQATSPHVNTFNPPNSSSQPYDGSSLGFQTLLEWLFAPGVVNSPGGDENTITVVLAPGVYYMNPVRMNTHSTNYSVKVIGSGMGATRLVMMPGIPIGNPSEIGDGGIRHIMFSTTHSPMYSFEIRDLTLDCNWSNQPGSHVSFEKGYQARGIHVAAEYATVENVRVTNWGSNRAKVLSDHIYAGAEAFGISVDTASIGQPGIPVQIKGCLVDDFHAVNFGYSTGIIVSTSNHDEPVLGNYAPLANSCAEGARYYLYHGESESIRRQYSYDHGCRRQWLAVVEGCTVDGSNYVNGITEATGFGAAKSQYVYFNRNRAINCKVGFNADTAPIDRLVIRNCRFEDVQVGVEVGNPSGGFSDIHILLNEVRLNGEPPYHRTDGTGIAGTVQGSFFAGVSAGFRLKGGVELNQFAYNRVYAVPQSQWRFVDAGDGRPTSPSFAYYIPLIDHEPSVSGDATEKMFGYLGNNSFANVPNTIVSPNSIRGNTTSIVPGSPLPAVSFPPLGGNWDSHGELSGAYPWDSLSGTDNVDVP